ncbi:ATP-dependent RNA helicase HrpA [Rarobacter faecitabidus]|uniref:ATP-dependent helicase HrpA n=1 Tax=Rarobacter faecitabidus TaxID=13243 RepID=A0A542ZA74_RARFA|nr:ATP-dependent RNA helicase HrpA [Rarobacter faecitabidus]TQL57201.1 ATP-dependent helicase HrpA [Rarobacter faecitabidus]
MSNDESSAAPRGRSPRRRNAQGGGRPRETQSDPRATHSLPDPAQARRTQSPQGRAPRGRRGKSGRRPAGDGALVLKEQLERAAKRRSAVSLPAITYPEQLPVSAHRREIMDAIAKHQVVIVAGETGSGKTTQLPKMLLELGRGRAGQIGHTQPRRIAARTVAERIAEELGVPLGGAVGYQVRFTDQASDDTLVKVMTDGILLAQIQRDPDLLAYDTLIIDEAHERSLNIDFILGYLARLLPRRPELKLVITSATIDSQRFAEHFAAGGDRADGDGAGGDRADGDGASGGEPAPVVEVSGRTFPVEIRYRPLVDLNAGPGKAGKGDKDPLTGLIEAVDELCAQGAGDILAFFSGEREILDAADALQGHLGPRTQDARRPDYVEILPLYARLSAAEQHRVFQPHPGRRIVLATNVAETSLTVPGIRYVIDPGTARISRYSRTTKVQRLPIEPISQASANQRAGRCGRVADGIAIRLYSEDDFLSRDEFTEPEILRTSLASVLLQMMAVGVVESAADMAEFPFVEPPDTRAVRDGVLLLTELGALSPGGHGLTDVGRRLALLPMDPRLGRMILESARHGVVREVMIIAAAMSVQDPRERPSEERAQADQLHARFADRTSDFLTYLNLWEYLRGAQRDLSGNAFRRMCRREYINYLRVREWQDVVSQLRELARGLDMRVNVRSGAPSAGGGKDESAYGRLLVSRRAGDAAGKQATTPEPVDPGTEPYARDAAPRVDGQATAHDEAPGIDLRRSWPDDLIHRSLLAGLLSQLGMQDSGEVKASAVAHLRGAARERALKRAKKQARNEYLGARGARFAIFPGSPLAKKPPSFVMAGELVETSRLWAREVARVEPEWAEELAGSLAKSSYSDPAWSRRRGTALVREKVTLYGVPIVVDRKIPYGRVDAPAAREMFIRHALVDGDWEAHHRFIAHNAEVRGEIEQVEARSRQRASWLDDDAVFAFFDARVPQSVTSAADFDKWWRRERNERSDLLNFSAEQLAPDLADLDPAQYPDSWPQGEWRYALTYQFSPGTDADGVTVHIPLARLEDVEPYGFDWMVPGLLDELVVASIRALPKALRVQLVPAPDVGADVANWLRANTPAWEDMARAGEMAAPFQTDFARAVRAVKGVDLPPGSIDGSRLPAHLRMTYRVTDQRSGSVIVVDESASLEQLQKKHGRSSQQAARGSVRGALAAALAEARDTPNRRRRDSERAPSGQEAATMRSGVGRAGSDLGSATSLEDESAPDQRSRSEDRSKATIVDDLVVDLGLSTKRITTRWSTKQALTLAQSGYGSTEELVRDLQRTTVLRLAGDDVHELTSGTYAGVLARLRPVFEDEVYRTASDTVATLTAARQVETALGRATSLALLLTVQDLRHQVATLMRPGFLVLTPPEQLRHLPRYLRAAGHRLERAETDAAKDQHAMARVHAVESAYRERAAKWRLENGLRDDAPLPEDLAHVRWMIEELRVSLFAQQLGTDGPVSEKRIHKALGTPGW